MKYLIIVLVIVLLFGCTAEKMTPLPDEVTIIEKLGNYMLVFELRGQLFLYMRSYGVGAITRLDHWD